MGAATEVDLKKLERVAVRKLRRIAKSNDAEMAHCDADGVLLDVLRAAGLNAVADAWGEVSKWYA